MCLEVTEDRLPWFVFAGGGTGGHLFPALSIVGSLRRRCPAADVSFFRTQRPIDRQVLGAAGVEAIPLGVLPFTTRPWQWPRFWRRWRESVALCRRVFERRRPAAVIGAGGYASGPPVHVALSLGIPTFLLNPDAVPGRANRYLGRRAGLTGIFAQWDVTRDHFPVSAPVEVAGCPVRPEFRALRPDTEAILRSFDLDPALHTLLVTGASQGARTINEAMILLADRLDWTGWQVLHLAGEADAARVTEAYATQGGGVGKSAPKTRVLPFTPRMPEAMAAADVIVSRAGASTLAEIQAVGRASILLPYPYHRDQHQRHNAMVLAGAGAAALIDDSRDAAVNAERLGPVLRDLMRDEARRSAMAEAAGALDHPDSADLIADRLLSAADSRLAAGCEFCTSPAVSSPARRTA
ncbi:MAG TPA: UDP-N-acetylglucosamine--N-acetylmuramyl-(pentapeptide) pyrophosphoryl-undecaprenol N-acetylglucosamine transferase [Phycisphaerae bacterium]|nr:UDP-N-acetylglucosamine--N-acetylmuramyl-(pentapeptide) pyrophosphoryl-undecaprenol N-acetylglucosamine transferase [Phycisphaerae bacterium]